MHSLNKVLQKLSNYVYKIFYFFATLSFSILLLSLLYNVFSRNFLGGSVSAIEEGSRFVFTWMMFLGISIGVYRKKHLGVGFLVDKFPPKLYRAIMTISNILSAILFIILIVYGFRYSMKTMRMLSPIMRVPYGAVYLCVPFCGILSLFYVLVRMVDDACSSKEECK